MMRHFLYVMRWVVLAVPGAVLLQALDNYMPTLGTFVYYIDQRIFQGGDNRGAKR